MRAPIAPSVVLLGASAAPAETPVRDPKLETYSQLVPLSADGVPPTEVELLKLGTTRTTKGDILCDQPHAQSCLRQLADDGRDLLPFDYDHDMVAWLGGSNKRAAGWFKLAERNGSLWATEIQWTPAAEKALRDREYRYFSPAIYRDDDGYVTRVINVALTCLPATLNQRPLVASQTGAEPAQGGNDMKIEELMAKFGAKTPEELEAKLAKFGELETQNAQLVTASQTLQNQVALSTAEIAKRDEAVKAEQKKSLIAKLSQDGKLAPALLSWAETQTIEQLQVYGAAVTPVAAAAVKVEASATAGADAAVLQLSAEDSYVCKQLKIAPEKFLATKKLLASQANPFACPVE